MYYCVHPKIGFKGKRENTTDLVPQYFFPWNWTFYFFTLKDEEMPHLLKRLIVILMNTICHFYFEYYWRFQFYKKDGVYIYDEIIV